MLADIRSGAAAVDLILVDTLERFGRVEELESIRRELHNRCGVLVLTADSGFADPTTSAGRAMAAFESMRAVEDGRVKAHNVLRGKRDAARRGRWPGGPPPFGMRLRSVLVDRHGRQEVDHCVLEHDPETAWVVRRLFALAGDGLRQQPARPGLNDDEEVPARFKPFSHSAVNYMLGNPIYHGELRWEANSTGIVDDTRVIEPNAEEDVLRVPGDREPLVPREDWDAVAALRRARRAAHERGRAAARDGDGKQIEPAAPGLVLKYLLTGLVRCGERGRSMRPMPSGRRSKAGKSYTYYACPGALVGACVNKTYVPEAWLGEAIVAAPGPALPQARRVLSEPSRGGGAGSVPAPPSPIKNGVDRR